MNGRFGITAALLVCWGSAIAGDWQQWLGPTRNGFVAADESLPETLPSNWKPLWRVSVGGGFASPIVTKGKVAVFGEDGTNEVLHLLDLETGQELWKVPVADRFADEWGAGPRATPFFDDDRIYAQSCNGEFRCLAVEDGTVLWGCSFEKDFGVRFLGAKAGEGTAARRGNNGCGVVDGNAVIVPVGSTNGATLVCFEKQTGAVLWKSGNDEAAYSSVMVADFHGVRQVVYLSADALLGVDRHSGRELWRVPLKTGAKRHAATPVVNENTVYVNSHTIGLLAFQIGRQGSVWTAKERWANRPVRINLATPILVNGSLFSHGPRKNFICADAAAGELRWEEPGFGQDFSAAITDGRRLLVLADDGQLTLLAADPQRYREVGRVQVCGKTWSLPAVAGGRMLVRDQRELVCYSLKF